MTMSDVQEVLAGNGVRFEAGLSTSEIKRIEKRFDFLFPSDLREFLSVGLPVSQNWLNWHGDESAILDRMAWPADGILYDIEHNQFWLDEWGSKPADQECAFAIARQAIAIAPVLIPVFSHRYLPAMPSEAGNPVFSVHQTDIIYYGSDLADYFANEFQTAFGRNGFDNSNEMRRIELWSQIVDANG